MRGDREREGGQTLETRQGVRGGTTQKTRTGTDGDDVLPSTDVRVLGLGTRKADTTPKTRTDAGDGARPQRGMPQRGRTGAGRDVVHLRRDMAQRTGTGAGRDGVRQRSDAVPQGRGKRDAAKMRDTVGTEREAGLSPHLADAKTTLAQTMLALESWPRCKQQRQISIKIARLA